MAPFHISMLDLPRALSPVIDETLREETPTHDDAAQEPVVVEPEPMSAEVCIQHGWNESVMELGALHVSRPELRQECLQALEEWLHKWGRIEVSLFFPSLVVAC